MDDSQQAHARAELRSILQTHGPQSVFALLGELCADEAKHRTDDEEVELWEIATDVAIDAVASLADDGDEDEDDEEDDVEADADDAETSDDASEAVEPAQTTRVTMQADDARTENHATKASEESVMKDVRLGSRPKSASQWKCFRVEGGKWVPVYHGENGIQVGEWGIKSCNADVIKERWGDGRYIVQYLMIDETGRRRPCGRSRELHVVGSQQETDALEPRVAPTVGVPLPPPATAPSVPMMLTQQPGGMDTLTVMAALREMEDRVQARAERRAQIEMERYRVDKELELERERMMSAERLKQMELQQRMVPRGGRDAVDIDAKIASVLAPIVNQISKLSVRVEEALSEVDDEDDDDPSAMVHEPPPPPDPFTKALETFAPIVEHLVSRLAPDPSKISIPSVSLPPADPAKKPN